MKSSWTARATRVRPGFRLPLQEPIDHRTEALDSAGRPEVARGDERCVERAVLGPIWFGGNARDDCGEEVLGRLGVVLQVAENSVGGDGFFLDLPAVVVGNHRNR